MDTANVSPLTYQERIDRLRATKRAHTEEKWRDIGILDMDDNGVILPPPEMRRYVETISGSGVPLTIIDPNATVSRRFYRVRVEP